MEELIGQLEKKQSEYTDLEEYSNEQNLTDKEFECLVNGWDSAFKFATLIIKENSYLFKK